jgi:hypothetical protein
MSSPFGVQNFSVELFHKCAGRGQIGKTPPKIDLAFSNNYPSMPNLNFFRPVKVRHPAAQFDIQWTISDDKLDDVRIFLLVRERLLALARHRGVSVCAK